MSGAVLITGVGKRVGLHLARTFLERGQPVIGTYRSSRASLHELVVHIEAIGSAYQTLHAPGTD